MIRLYDTLTGEIRPLAQRDEGKVSFYACGPTVYDHPHLGHARQAMTYDIVRRYLEWRGLEVLHVANVTDIDDNIINRASDEGITEPEVAATWEAIYFAATDALDILHPHERPHATDFVDEMVAFIQVLLDNGTAYANESGVYLRVHKVDGYGDLVHRSLDDLREGAGARVEVDETKEDPLDFALWKAAKPGEPTWPAPWGEGRPGWHIECVAMSPGHPRRRIRPARRRIRPGVSPSHQRTSRSNRRGTRVRLALGAQRHAQHRRREDVEVARQLQDHPRNAR